MILEPSDDVERLRLLGEEWKASANGSKFGMSLDVDILLSTMNCLVTQPNGDVLVLVSDDEIKGFIGLTYLPNHVGKGIIANECCFFVSSSARGGGLKLLRAAEKIIKLKGCSFSTINASRIAGNADRSGKLYEHCGYVQFETSYIKAI